MLRKAIVQQIAKEFNLSSTQVELLYKLWWREVKNLIESNNLTNYKECPYTDINIPRIGKLVIDTHKADIINERINSKRYPASEHSDSDNS